jgi:hypothetical protein
MISRILRLLILLLIVNIIFGFNVISDDNQRLYQLLKQRSAENDNEYVWFTRNAPTDEIKQDQLQKYQDLIRSKILKNSFNRKYPLIENMMYEKSGEKKFLF